MQTARRFFPLFVSVVLTLWLTSCQTNPFAPANPPPPPTCEQLAQQEQRPENLPFETIARESYYYHSSENSWQSDAPGLFIATTPIERAQIEQYIREDSATALENVDLNATPIVAVFSGVKGAAAWQFCITSITRQEQTVTLHIHLIDSPVQLPEIASYYHLIQLLWTNLPTGEITVRFALTRHEYAYKDPNQSQVVLERSEEEIVSSITRSLP